MRLKIDVDKLKELCDQYFVSYMVAPYAGATRECLYCGATESRAGEVDHSYSDCPIIKYQEILNNKDT